MTKDQLLICAQQCLKDKECCEAEKCRFNINFEREYNCCLISVYLNGPLSLRQVAEREGISFSRVKQIENQTLFKLKKNNSEELSEELFGSS
jgi:hypothetical protein